MMEATTQIHPAPLSALGSLGVSSEDAMSVSEIARLYGVTPGSAHRYTLRNDFPEPLAATSAGRVWLRADVERWGREHLPLQTGRPRKERRDDDGETTG
jgi:DNA-binding IclR family transcriptional regulator